MNSKTPERALVAKHDALGGREGLSMPQHSPKRPCFTPPTRAAALLAEFYQAGDGAAAEAEIAFTAAVNAACLASDAARLADSRRWTLAAHDFQEAARTLSRARERVHALVQEAGA